MEESNRWIKSVLIRRGCYSRLAGVYITRHPNAIVHVPFILGISECASTITFNMYSHIHLKTIFEYLHLCIKISCNMLMKFLQNCACTRGMSNYTFYFVFVNLQGNEAC